MVLRVPGSGDVPIPLVVPSDAGYFVKALTQVPAGKNLIAYGDRMTWAEYVQLWSRITGVPATFEKTTVAEHAELSKLSPEGYGEEIAEMYGYAQDFGYDGSDPTVITPDQVSIEPPYTYVCVYTQLIFNFLVHKAWRGTSDYSNRAVYQKRGLVSTIKQNGLNMKSHDSLFSLSTAC